MHRAPKKHALRRAGWIGALMAMLVAVIPAAIWGASPAGAVTGAAFTTTNTVADGTGHCKNGNEAVNCNIYDGKEFVWLNGGPVSAFVGDGTYFFAVLSPGGQPAPNDGGSSVANGELANLSDNFDNVADRTFSVTDATVTNLGTHDFGDNKIRLMPYADTPNHGGVYILAICSLGSDGSGYPVTPSKCKYDAFKIRAGDTETPEAVAPTVIKDADGAYSNTYQWTISKDVDKTLVQQVGGNATFNYTVKAGHDAGTISGVTVTGTISVFNGNSDLNGDPIPVDITGVTDQLSDSTACTVTDGGPQTLTAIVTTFAYSCSLSALPAGQLDNTAAVSWDTQILSNTAELAAGNADFVFEGIGFTGTTVDDCVAVTDTVAGALGSACVGDVNPKSFTYSRTVTVPASACVSYDNTATFSTNITGATGSASQTVTACGGVAGGLTIGFWQNKNGQGIISSGASTAGVCNSGAWLRGYQPFQALSATATCGSTATYVYNVIKVATCTSTSKTCNSMLKAQMLATALNVYFSNPTLGGNRINAPKPIGGVKV
ncbi:MAG: hypothetical protein QOH80_1624, partial [Actinomycetota bacterium]|nr:hypothetical protein [Actinomycetota bacterium]